MAVIENYEYFECDESGCQNRVKNHNWGRAKAEGWFWQKDGKGFCLEHVPSWVRGWRLKKAKNGS